jgi:hypothetical protein
VIIQDLLMSGYTLTKGVRKKNGVALVLTIARGARQLVVQLALEMMLSVDLYFSWFTPMTYLQDED